MVKDAADSGKEFVLAALTKENIAELNNFFPEKFEYRESREALTIFTC